MEFRVGDEVEVVRSCDYAGYKGKVVVTGNAVILDNGTNWGLKESLKLIRRANMTKSDLRDGMVVECENGNRYVYVNGDLISDSDFLKLSYLKDDLTSVECIRSEFDIVAVHGKSCCSISSLVRDVLWTRPSTPSIEVSVKVNGKEAKLSDISEESLLKMRSV